MDLPGFVPHVSRRRLLQVGGLGLVGLPLPELLRADAASGHSEKSCIYIFLYGGAPQLDSFDLKPDAPQQIRGPYQPIATNVPGTQICEKLPLLAQRASQYCLIRSMTTASNAHQHAINICMTGNSKVRLDDDTPSIGSVMSDQRPSTRNAPSYVWLLDLDQVNAYRWFYTGGFLGMGHSALRVGAGQDNPANPKFRFKDFDPPDGTTVDRIAQRKSLLASLESQQSVAGQGAASFTTLQKRAFELVTGSSVKLAFDPKLEKAETRERYGMHPLGQNLLVARRLIESGVRLVSVVGHTGVGPGHRFSNVQTWDMHGGGLGSIFGNGPYGLNWALPNLDQAVSALLDDLKQRGLLENTLVVVNGEFGRTPTISKSQGRDHWPHCFSALLAGCGIRGGSVYGASDKHAAQIKDKPVSPDEFGATIFHALGVDPHKRFGPDGFTNRVSNGEPLRDLFG